MNIVELVNLQKQIKEEFEAVKTEFEEYCSHYWLADEGREVLIEDLINGEEYDGLDAHMQEIFLFIDGKERRRFDVLRNKGGLLCRLYKMINEITKEESIEDEWFNDIEFFELNIERLVETSKKIVSDEQDFLKTSEKVLGILNELPENN